MKPPTFSSAALKDAETLRHLLELGPPMHFAVAPTCPHPSIGTGWNAKDWLAMQFSPEEAAAVELVATTRVPPLRDFDQIAMQAGDLLRQVKLIAPYLSGKRVLFVGDNDGASRLLGLLGAKGLVPLPERMALLDFDERILVRTREFTDEHGLGSLLDTRLYNVFDAPPPDLVGHFDWFYINPPYGASNGGESVCLFMRRGMEMCVPGAGQGCIIIPDADQGPWTEEVMAGAQRTLVEADWLVREKLERMHRYHLEDAPELTSCLMIARSRGGATPAPDEYQGRAVSPQNIPRFYGMKVQPPFPRYIRTDGSYDYEWEG